MRRTTRHRWLVLFAALVVTVAAPALASARAWLGVYTQEVTSELRDALDLSGDGVLVTRVVPGSPAERAGVRKGDVIVSVDRKSVDSPGELSEIVGDSREGESVSLSIKRRGDDVILAVRLAARPNDDGEDEGDDDSDEMDVPTPPAAPAPPLPPRAPKAPKAPREMRWYSSDGNVDPEEIRERVREVMPNFDFDGPGMGNGRVFVNGIGGRGRLGVRIETLSDDLASALGASGTHGALVVEVLKGTPAEKAGLRAGDVITAVEGSAVADGDDLVKALRNEDGKVSLSVVRRGEKRSVEAELEDAPRVIRLRDGEGLKGLGRMGDLKKFDVHVKGDADDEDLRKELQELRDQLRELREELRNRNR